MKWRLDGYRAVVTGGSRGIGQAIVREFVSLGASVVNVALSDADIEADVSTEEGRRKVLEGLPGAWDSIDILVNNVGMNIRKPTLDYTLDEYEQVQRTNATSMYELSRMLFPRLAKSGRGSIVNIGSVAGLQSVGSSAAYAMSKAAVAHMSRYLAVEWAKHGVRVNAVAPGWVETQLTAGIQATPRAMRLIEERTPLGRMAKPEEIAGVAVFLCMPGASYLTGAVIPVDGAMGAYCMDITGALA